MRRRLSLLGPGFVAAIAYVDPGNVATNTEAGAQYGYLLVWVVVAANLMAALVQYLSARLGLLTGRSLPELVSGRLGRRARLAYWAQAELIAVATDLAEVVGGAVALLLLFGLPILWGAVITIIVSTAMLMLQSRRRQKVFERVVMAMLAIVAVGFLAGLVLDPPDASAAVAGLVPRLAGPESLLLAAGVLGATIMPHAVYLHSALIRDRHGSELRASDLGVTDRGAPDLGPATADGGRAESGVRSMLGAIRTDIAIAMTVAGAVNLGLLLLAASALSGVPGIETLQGFHALLGDRLGEGIALLFALALLASGLASTAVGSYAGAVIMEGLLHVRIPLLLRRLLTAVPSLLILAAGADPTRALILSQVVLSFGIPFALIPLVRLNSDRQVLGRWSTGSLTTGLAWGVITLVVCLNVALVGFTAVSLV